MLRRNVGLKNGQLHLDNMFFARQWNAVRFGVPKSRAQIEICSAQSISAICRPGFSVRININFILNSGHHVRADHEVGGFERTFVNFYGERIGRPLNLEFGGNMNQERHANGRIGIRDWRKDFKAMPLIGIRGSFGDCGTAKQTAAQNEREAGEEFRFHGRIMIFKFFK